MLSQKFRGALLGNVVGDCLGEKFECAEHPIPSNLKAIAKFFDSLHHGNVKKNSLPYTDDTAMTIVLSKCLIENKKVDDKYLAKNLTKLYFDEPGRGYGLHVSRVFMQLKVGTSDVLKPAREQFDGRGSYGNGAAMRVTPIGLFYHNDVNVLIKEAHQSSLITHSHENGYIGAILQALAVRQALIADPDSPLDPSTFLQILKTQLAEVEDQTHVPGPFMQQLKKMETLLSEEKPPIEKVVELLGNDVTALKSVPIAIYSVLAAQKPIEGIETNNVFERTIHYAINLGGDTDTIACMAGGICGAHLGESAIPQHLIVPCEGRKEIVKLADELLDVAGH